MAEDVVDSVIDVESADVPESGLAEVCGAFFRDGRQPRLDVGQLAVVEDADGVQPLRVHGGRRAVVREELVVLGAEERIHVGIERDAGACGPERHAGTSSSGWP